MPFGGEGYWYVLGDVTLCIDVKCVVSRESSIIFVSSLRRELGVEDIPPLLDTWQRIGTAILGAQRSL